MEIRKDNDFKIKLEFMENNGEAMAGAEVVFRFVYSDNFGVSYEVSFDGEVRKNCYIGEDGGLYAIFEKHGFHRGVLKREEHYRVADSAFSDGFCDLGETYTTNIEMV